MIREFFRQLKNVITDVSIGGDLAYDPIPILIVGTLFVSITTLLLTALSIIISIIW